MQNASVPQTCSFPSLQEGCSPRVNGFIRNSSTRKELLGLVRTVIVKRAVSMESSNPLRSWSVTLPEVRESEKFAAVKSWCKAEV